MTHRLAAAIRLPSGAAGVLCPVRSLPRNLLQGSQLAPRRSNHRSRQARCDSSVRHPRERHLAVSSATILPPGAHPLTSSAPQPLPSATPQSFQARGSYREISRRARRVGRSFAYLRGWLSYFGFCQTPSVLRDLESWLRRRLRAVLWKQWKRGRTRFTELRKRGVGAELAAKTAGSAHGPWPVALG